MLNGIIWREKTGAPWRDIPERYGPWQSRHDHFVRWSRSGVWAAMLAALQLKANAEGKIDWDDAALDSTHVKAHRSTAGARKQSAKLKRRGRSKTSGSASFEKEAAKSTS